ncbi:hypothetical protein SAMN05216576_10628 [Ectopseudomonas chengduensis]|uniref:Uncharacterized protein n=1 Tax=Ectopseudomonas chengduensis TaxID=489632 RepID=A0A1G6P1K1_9GAMM|nr:hypothetical protein [Pseudomonas chengduensis]NNB73448.1 hypothetical protein [Pseudomonas chengduensis]SDC73327.1 hypothetical protein SAMN05216576_10628 [Pseudomonas chengduensis]
MEGGAVKERPILFSAPMVRAILEGRKTVTRRVVKPAFPASVFEVQPFAGDHSTWMPVRPGASNEPWEEQIRVCPYGKPGDRLWVRETFARVGTTDPGYLTYRATYPRCLPAGLENVPADIRDAGERWRPSIHMPRAACRILLEVIDVRVERLQDISEEQARAEGVASCADDLDPDGNGYSPYELFSALWVSINGDDSWHANPWVWVVEFKRVEQSA